jgi:spore photoproduct lyase
VTNKLQARRDFWPHTVFVDASAAADAMTERVISRIRPERVIPLGEYSGDPLSRQSTAAEIDSEFAVRNETETFSHGKRTLMLTRYRGGWLKACPGTSGHVCCNLWIVNPGEGCPMDCTYCYLQSYLRRNPTLKIYTNTSEMTAAIEERAKREPSRLFRVGTGEVFDSLVWDDVTDLTLELVPFFARVPNITLELKSKHDFVDNLLSLAQEHRGKTVVSWSVNAASVSEKDEAFTAPLARRIAAAEKVVAAGYKVGFHFDPLVYFPGWEDEYRDTVEKIFSRISPKNVAWVSVSSLRYQQEMQTTMIERFPASSLPFGEQFLAKDRKLRYVQPIRFRMLQFVWDQLKARGAALPVYMCMESSAAWRNVAGGPPVAGSELVEIFSRRGRLPVLTEEEESVSAHCS